MRFLRSILAIVALLLAGAWSEAHAGTIYDNTTTLRGEFGFSQKQLGGEVHAAGTDRLVTDLFIGMYRKGDPGPADMQARLYANDGLGGNPGTLLWQSPLLQNVHLSSGIDLIDFSVPMVLVPDTFTWTVQFSNLTTAVLLPTFDPPTIGDSLANWEGNGTVWAQVPRSPFEARVEAVSEVPEPSSAMLLLAGSTLVLFGRVWCGRRGRFSFGAIYLACR